MAPAEVGHRRHHRLRRLQAARRVQHHFREPRAVRDDPSLPHVPGGWRAARFLSAADVVVPTLRREGRVTEGLLRDRALPCVRAEPVSRPCHRSTRAASIESVVARQRPHLLHRLSGCTVLRDSRCTTLAHGCCVFSVSDLRGRWLMDVLP